MGDKDHQEQDLLVKQLTRHYIQEQIEALKRNKHDKNSSFIYLDSKTLNMLIVYLLAYIEGQNDHQPGKRVDDESVPKEFIDELDLVMRRNKNNFEELLSFLKKET